MAVASFEELCKGLCELADVPIPDLAPGEDGVVAIAIELQDVKILVSSSQQSAPDRALVHAVFGDLPVEKELDAFRALLELNSQVQSLGYSFGRNAVTGEIVLQHDIELGSATPADLYQRIVNMVDGIEGWRQHHFLTGDQGMQP